MVLTRKVRELSRFMVIDDYYNLNVSFISSPYKILISIFRLKILRFHSYVISKYLKI